MPRRVAIVTDSTADLPPDIAAARGIAVVPLFVTFGEEQYRAGVDMSTAQFWERMLTPGAPWPGTAAAAPGTFRDAFQAAFDAGAEAVVCITISTKLSASFKSAEIGAGMLPDRDIAVLDSESASIAEGLLVLHAADLADEGRSGAEIAGSVRSRMADLELFLAMDTIEYLRKGGRLSAGKAAIATLLSIKPIITVADGLVEVVEQPRTRSKARARVLERVAGGREVEKAAVLYSPGEDTDPAAFRDQLLVRLPGAIDPATVMLAPLGPSIGPHIGPRAMGAVVLRRSA
jgi:fatty acid kinase fatty acid binding subunit